MYGIYTYIGVVPEGSMGRHIWQSHGVFGIGRHGTADPHVDLGTLVAYRLTAKSDSVGWAAHF